MTLGFLAGIFYAVGSFSDVIEGSNGTFSAVTDSPETPFRLSVLPQNPWVKPGETVTFKLYADGGVGVSAAELALSYGSDVEVVDVKPGPYLGEEILSAPDLVDQEAHHATYAWARIRDTPDQAPPGELALIAVKVSDGYPWNSWVTAQVTLTDGQFQKFQTTSHFLNLHVYDSLPVPMLLGPVSRFHSSGAPTGPRPEFEVKTLSPGAFKYKIEVSEDGFRSVLHTFDQTGSPAGWDQAEYVGGDVAEFISPKSLQPGQYKWRAYAWVQEIGQWGQPSRPEKFAVSSEPAGLTGVTPPVVTRLDTEGAPVTLEGWDFTPDTKVRWSLPGGGELAPEVHWESPTRLTVMVPPNTQPGLAMAKLSRPGGEELTLPVLVLPPSLFTVQTELPWADQIIPGKEFSILTMASNYGTDPDSVAVIAVHLPNSDLFELVEVTIDRGGRVLEQRPDRVLLLARHGSRTTFKFQAAEELGASSDGEPGSPIPAGALLDMDFKPVVLEAVTEASWRELEALPVPQRVETVQVETAQELGRIAQTFNQASHESLRIAFQQFAANGDSLGLVMELITRLQAHGLDPDR
ncbi:MAG TPA: cohesin domain-containing protein, partial [Dehalococcoidia bacterium]|nr:cohesin domain-containing protein [Dehalococcoidia bacterium]